MSLSVVCFFVYIINLGIDKLLGEVRLIDFKIIMIIVSLGKNYFFVIFLFV